MIDLPSFASWFAAVNDGRSPLPWQERLAAQVVATGWPSLIGVPTGLGKTTCLDIAVWALAAEADRPPVDRCHPRRIWYVVNRRLLVDTAATKATHLANMLAEQSSPEPNVAAVAERLRAFGGLGEEPLHVATLRGGADLGQRPPDPAQPAIILATPAMYGSRWLFRGFGTTTGMRSVDAALAGTDSLVLLDEAHLARPLRRLEAQTADCDRGRSAQLLPAGRGHVRFTELTATGDDSADRFDLDDADYGHPIVVRRLDADKPVRLEETTQKKIVGALVSEACEWFGRLTTSDACLVFCNDPTTARSVHAEVTRKLSETATTLLLTGRMREREAQVMRDLVLDPVGGCRAGSRAINRPLPLLIIATQTLEVGADLDVDCLITVSSGARSLIQRFGRLNRLGEKPHATGVIVHAIDGDGGIYGDEVATVWQRLIDGADEHRIVLLSPRRIAEAIGSPTDAIEEPPMLLPGILWEWAKTTVAPPGEAPVEVFIEGRVEQRRRLQVCWRAVRRPYLPDPDHDEPDDDEAERPKLVPVVTARETVELPVHEVQAALEEQGRVARLTGDRSSLEWVDVDDLRSGDTVVLETGDGYYDRFGWNPQAAGNVADVSLFEGSTFLLAREAVHNCVSGPAELVAQFAELCDRMGRLPGPDDESPTLADLPAVDELSALVPPEVPEGQERWQQVLTAIRDHLGDGRSDAAALERPLQGVAYLRFPRSMSPSSASVRLEAMEELSFAIEGGPSVQSPVLADHLRSVGSSASHLATALGLAPELIEACAIAGALHDLGKYDDRFQRWLTPDGDERGAMAKSSQALGAIEQLRRAAGWPKGGRHEALSLRLARALYDRHPADDHDADLVLHLIVSHHGHGRPSLPPCDDRVGGFVTAPIEDEEFTVSADLSVLDWDQPARFHLLCERYGLWGLALLEAVVRQADHAVSKVVVA